MTGQKIEIVKQVKLSPKQRIAILDAASYGGRFENTPDCDTRVTLRHLGLIEERKKYEGQARAAHNLKIREQWKKVPEAYKTRNHTVLERIASDLRSLHYDLDRKCWWLTKAAHEYLRLGKVVVTAGAQMAGGK